jgi:hypothetical protein
MPLTRAAVVTLALALVACGGESSTPAPTDASRADLTTVDAVAKDVAVIDAAVDVAVDAGSREAGGTCSFNQDCIATERCSCTESSGCRCVVGARGRGRPGADTCNSGDECASAVCVEANGGVSRCSAPCASASDCPAELPRCISVSFVGRICVRDPTMTVGDAGTGTALTGRFGTRTAGFERAQHGRAGVDRVYLEAHSGGDPACPTMMSPSPRRTLVVSGVRVGTAVQTEADGVTASLLDFTSELVSAPIVRATAVRVTPRAINPGTSVSLEIDATFPGGTITGTVVSPHCDSLDE